MDLAQGDLFGGLTLPRYGACWQLDLLSSWVYYRGLNPAAALREKKSPNTASVNPAS